MSRRRANSCLQTTWLDSTEGRIKAQRRVIVVSSRPCRQRKPLLATGCTACFEVVNAKFYRENQCHKQRLLEDFSILFLNLSLLVSTQYL